MSWTAGASLANTERNIYLSLRGNRLGEIHKVDGTVTDANIAEFRAKAPKDCVLDFTESASKGKTFFYLKPYSELIGYIDKIAKRDKELDNGAVLTSLDLHISAGDTKYVVRVGSKDNPYLSLVSRLCNVDFRSMVKIAAWRDKETRRQNLVVWQQHLDKPVQPKYPIIWRRLSDAKAIKELLSKKQPLTPELEKKVMRKPDGSIDPDYPYIKEYIDNTGKSKYDFEPMENMLLGYYVADQESGLPRFVPGVLQNEVIPACEVAFDDRGYSELPTYAGTEEPPYMNDMPAGEDDEIPF